MNNDSEENELYTNLKNKCIIQLNIMTGEKDDSDKLKAIDDYFYALMKPKIYWGSEGAEIQFDKSFETTCAVISQNLSRDPKVMMTLEYLNTIEELKKQFKAHSN